MIHEQKPAILVFNSRDEEQNKKCFSHHNGHEGKMEIEKTFYDTSLYTTPYIYTLVQLVAV